MILCTLVRERTMGQAIAVATTPSTTYDRVIFCDFDGTIAVHDTFVGAAELYAPGLWAELKLELYSFRMSLREAITKLLAGMPADCYPKLADYARDQPIRAGFAEFLEFLDGQNVPIVVVSGGVRSMVETTLAPYLDRLAGVYAVNVEPQGAGLSGKSPFESDTEMLAKYRVIEQFAPREAILIGDSITDLEAALQVPLVFARSHLIDYLTQQQKSFVPWSDFFEIRDYLAQSWGS
jgi:2-hydroxy-3-keto-5-methylthiopentenyl-1-phosphate phosphatase